MISSIAKATNFNPVILEITFQSHFELSDFIQRLKADNHLPTSVDKLIQQLEFFEKSLK